MEPRPAGEHETIIERLCDEGRFLDAYRTGEAALGPLEAWTSEQAGPLASRIAAHLGAPRRSDAIDLRLHRRHPRAAWAFARYVGVVHERRGPLEALRRLEGYTAPAGTDEQSAGAIALDRQRIEVAVGLRDFDTAEEILRRREAGGVATWVREERASWLMAQDRHAEAIAVLREGLARAPDDMRLGMTLGFVEQVCGHSEAALEHLGQVQRRAQSVVLSLRHANLLIELGHPEQAQRVLDGIESPMLESEVAAAIAGQRSESAYKRGDRATAVAEARRAGTPFFERLARRLEHPAGERRVELAVPFVRQHHRTCAPATLAALAGFWEQPTEHLEIADDICYDGTSDHAKRRWASEHGWRAVEFTVTWACARELLERGVPFALTTAEAHGAHLQAVMGFDEARGTLLIRDPTIPVMVEADAEALFDHYRSVGPRGMAMVPAARSSLLDGLELPDAGLHDLVHELQLALDAHRRPDAIAARDRLQERAPSHALARWADVALAMYDHDHGALLRASERLLELFPGDVMTELMALRSLRAIGSRTERLERLERAVERRDQAHPIFAEELAAELLPDARAHERVGRLLRRCARALPGRGRTVALLGELARVTGRPDEAASRLRLASCLDRVDEEMATRSLLQAQATGRAAAELGRLRRRREQLGARSPASIVTYCWALERTGDQQAALAELEAALREHPTDGALLRVAARWLGAAGEPERAAELLAQAEPRSRRVDWLEVSADLAQRRGDSARALELWREVLDLEPLSDSAQAAYVHLLEATGRPVDAQAFLDGLVGRFPHHIGLAVLRAATLRDDATRYKEALRELTRAFPAEPWAHRELAVLRAERGQVDKARASLARALALDARSAAALRAEATVQTAAGDREGAAATLRRAVLLHPDDPSALPGLLDLLEPPARPDEALAFARDAVARGSLNGVGVAVWHAVARAHDPARLDEGSAALLEARPDLPLAWSERADTLLTRGAVDEADRLLERASARFPLEARLLCARAEVAAARQQPDAEIALLERAFALDPELPTAPRRLAALHTAAGRIDQARATLGRALGRSPQQHSLAVELARLDQRAGQPDLAAERLERLLRQAPQLLEAWSLLQQLDRPEPIESAWRLVEQLVAAMPRHPEAHLARAHLALTRNDTGEALQSLDRVTALTPRSAPACDLRMQVLQQLGRTDEALALVEPGRWGGVVPVFLEGRAAEVLASSGQLARAADRMREIVERHPDYFWGWSKLRGWSLALGDPPGSLEAARQLVRLEPRSASVHAALGDALDDVGSLDEAARALERALQLDPLHVDAANLLGQVAMRRGDLAQAGSALERLRASSALDPPRLSLMADFLESLVAAASGQADRARAALTRLASRPDASLAVVRARKALLEAGLTAEAQDALADAIVRPDAPDLAASLWLGTERARGRWSDDRLDELRDQPLFEPLLRAEMTALAGRPGWSGLGRLLRRHASAIDESPSLWLASAKAVAVSWSPLRAALYLRDVARHPSVALDASVEHALVLHALGLSGQATRLHAASSGVDAAHWSTPHHHLWLAFDAALAGGTRRAERHLAVLESMQCDHFPEQIRQLTRAAIAYWRLPVRERRAALAHLETDLQQSREHDPPLDPLRTRVLARIRAEYTDRLAHGVEGFDSLLWLWDSRPLAPLLAVLLVVLAVSLLPDNPAAGPWLGAAFVALLLWFFRRPLLAL